MTFDRCSTLLTISIGLSLSLLALKVPASASNHGLDRSQADRPLISQFDPTDTDPLDTSTPIDVAGGRYFQPPDDSHPLSGPFTTPGTRSGCATFSNLGPQSVAGLTIRDRPEFVWHITEAEATASIQFRLLLLEETNQATIVDEANFTPEVGFMTYQLPDTVPPLSIGEEYLWQVIVKCDSNKPSSFLVSMLLPLRVVAPTSDLTQALATATTDAERAQIYGNAGIWYEALALVASGTPETSRTVRTGLLEDLATVERDDEIFSKILSDIAEHTTLLP